MFEFYIYKYVCCNECFFGVKPDDIIKNITHS